MKLLILNGPNINMLGIREPELYGKRTYGDLCDYVAGLCREQGADYEIFQSNHEGVLIDKIQEAYGRIDGIVINPGGYTHTSVAIADALKAVAIPTAEVHLTDVSAREAYRQISYVREACLATFAGCGFESYAKAIQFITKYLQSIH